MHDLESCFPPDEEAIEYGFAVLSAGEGGRDRKRRNIYTQ